MAVGHHTAYEKAMQVWSGTTPLSAMLQMLEDEKDDLEYSIVLYGLLQYPDCDEQECLYEKLLSRGGFWPSFAYLAAWNDGQEPYSLSSPVLQTATASESAAMLAISVLAAGLSAYQKVTVRDVE